MMVQINITEAPNHLLLEVAGDIDASSSIELDNALKQAAERNQHMLVDLTGLQYISSAGLGVFISYLEDLQRADVQMVLFGLQPKVREVFEILGLQHLMAICNDRHEALALLK